MITLSNYQEKAPTLDFAKLPPSLKEGHQYVTDFADLYNEDADIKEAIDLYLTQLNRWVHNNYGQRKEPKAENNKDAILKSDYIFKLWKEYATKYPEKRTQPDYVSFGKQKGLDERVIDELYIFNSNYVDANIASKYDANSIKELNEIVKKDAEQLKVGEDARKSFVKKYIAPSTNCQILDNEGKPDISAPAIKKLENCTARLPQTKSEYYHNGHYTAEREKLHNHIIDEFKAQKPCVIQREPIAVLTGGPPGSGKSTWLKKYANWITGNNVYHIDADEVRAKLPEYKGWNATATHLETKDIVNRLIDDIGNPCEYDLVYDGTMNKSDNYQPLIDKLKKLGYKVFIIYISVPKKVSEQRVLERYRKRGRYVPKVVIDEVYERGLDAFEKLIKQADGYIRVNGETGKIIEKGGMPIPKNTRYKEPAKAKAHDCGCQHKKEDEKCEECKKHTHRETKQEVELRHKNAEQFIKDLEAQPEKLRALSDEQIISIGLEFQKNYRQKGSITRDTKHDSVKRLSPHPENLIRWMKNPGKFDLIGVDTFERLDPTADYKRLISKQKFWNIYGIKA